MLRYVAVAALACLLSFSLARTNWVRSLENIYCDYWHLWSGVRYQPRHTVFISIDDETLAALKDDPLVFWAPHFARVMDTLAQAGVKAVGLDVLYQVSAESWLRKLELPDSTASRNFDSPLRAALAKGDKILITQLVEGIGRGLAARLRPLQHPDRVGQGVNPSSIPQAQSLMYPASRWLRSASTKTVSISAT